MTANVDIVNRALMKIGTRSTLSAAELVANSSNEAIQANIVLTSTRDELLRMAPWDCAINYANLVYITSVPGTPENQTSGAALWSKGIPPPPWLYEYQYPVDCLRVLFVLPQFSTGFAGAIPLTSAVSGAPSYWQGPPARFKIGLDQFYTVTAASVAAGGSGYNLADIITLASGPATSNPIGAPAQLFVATVSGGAVTSVTPVNQILGESAPQGGSYLPYASGTVPNPVAQASTTGNGIGATFNLTYSNGSSDQRVILTNQENATVSYIRQITDPNVMDPLFIEAWSSYLAAKLVIALSGDKALANQKLNEVNMIIMEARKNDANEGLTINDVMPDWIRARGGSYPSIADMTYPYPSYPPLFSIG